MITHRRARSTYGFCRIQQMQRPIVKMTILRCRHRLK